MGQWGRGALGTHIHCQWASTGPLWETLQQFFRKLNINFHTTQQHPFPGILAKEIRIDIHINTIKMFIASLIIVKNWKQANQEREKLWHIYKLDYYSEVKRNRPLILQNTYESQNSVLSERSEIQKAKHCGIPFL